MKISGVCGVTRRKFLGDAALVAMALRSGAMFGQGAAAVVKAPCGTLRGEVVDGVKVFRGVPVAEAPVGALRFMPPVRVKAWSGERDATKFAPAAMQANPKGGAASEDCLYLNVYAPAAKSAKALPVLVWIYGGGFLAGHSSGADGTKFAADGVVVVTVAYRLGVFGFLDFGPLLGKQYAGSANNAVKDLMVALEWVRENIAAFGGDPGRVTVGGQSAGAKLTDTLLGTPGAEGLFGQAISESGGAERLWASAAEAAVASHAFAEVWQRVSGKGVSAVLTADAGMLLAAQSAFVKAWPHRSGLRPMVDGELLKRLPVESIAGGVARGKRLLIGSNREESAAMIGPHPAEVKANEIGGVTAERFAAVEARYAKVYPAMSEEMRRVRALTAEEYWVPSVRAADALVKGGGRAWMYLFELPERYGPNKGLAPHAEELNLVWDKPRNDPNAAAVETMMHPAWVSFVKGMAPAAEGMPMWTEYRSEARATMVFDTKTRVEMKPQEAELRLWDGVL